MADSEYYYAHFKNEDPSGQAFFNVHRVGINFGRVDWNFHQPGAHYHSLYHNFEKGSSVVSEHELFDLTPETLLFIPEGTSYEARTLTPARHAYIEFSLTTSVQPLDSVQQVEADSTCRALFDLLHESVKKRSGMETICFAQAILHLASLPLGLQMQTLPEELKRVLSRIARNRFCDTTESLASSAGQHPDRFTRWFRHHLKMTPAKYIRRAQIREAARLLRSTEKSVEEIAEECGFPNRFYLSRVFDLEVGMGPGEYRRKTPTNSPLHQITTTTNGAPSFPFLKTVRKPKWKTLPIGPWANRPCDDPDGWLDGTALTLGPTQKRNIHGIPFQLAFKENQAHAILLSSSRIPESGGQPLPREVILPVKQSAQAVYILHTTAWVTRPAHLANYVIRYRDGKVTSFPVWAADNREISNNTIDPRASVQDWYPFLPPLRNEAAVPWVLTGGAGSHEAVFHVLQLTNPNPENPMESITLSSLPSNRCPLAILAIALML